MLGFIGCGTMGGTLLEGIIKNQLVAPEKIVIFDQDAGKMLSLKDKLEVNTATNVQSLCLETQKIFLAVKPQDMKELLLEMKPVLNAGHLLISVAAGLYISFFQKHLGKSVKIIRIMPNTPCLVGEGMSVISRSQAVSEGEEKEIAALMGSLGKVISLEEKHMSAVTGLSGSGPAYIFLVMEALADGGVEMGLSRDVALFLAAQTVLGAAKMFLQTGEHPAIMKNKVTSPGGTTSAGLLALEEGAVKASLIKAVIQSAQKEKNMLLEK
ncbi:MAG: pyrroline-5-carboxylate reductase [Dethiobacter sp.]|jgi:pyrroline-5-carboxylate reductase|nr:MAG: pyrroline-5-carboxylate reductase [Dethiobacter sp.]